MTDSTRIRLRAAGLIALVLASAGCANKPAYFRGSIDTEGGTLAVLPLVNFSQHEQASELVAGQVIVELLDARSFGVLDPGAVDDAVMAARIRVTDRLPAEQLLSLGETLGASHVLMGTINEFRFIQEPDRRVPVVSISLRIVTCADGRIVWAATHSRRGDDTETVFGLGRVETLEQLSAQTVREMTISLKKPQS